MRRRYYIRLWRAWVRVPLCIYQRARGKLPRMHKERIARRYLTR